MNLSELIDLVHAATGWAPAAIGAIVRAAWPSHTQFTPTQAALVEQAVIRRQAAMMSKPQPITHEQLLGEETL